MSSGNAPNALSSSPLSRTRLAQCLACGEPSLVKCLLRGISRQSLKAVANCFLEDIPALRADQLTARPVLSEIKAGRFPRPPEMRSSVNPSLLHTASVPHGVRV